MPPLLLDRLTAGPTVATRSPSYSPTPFAGWSEGRQPPRESWTLSRASSRGRPREEEQRHRDYEVERYEAERRRRERLRYEEDKRVRSRREERRRR